MIVNVNHIEMSIFLQLPAILAKIVAFFQIGVYLSKNINRAEIYSKI